MSTGKRRMNKYIMLQYKIKGYKHGKYYSRNKRHSNIQRTCKLFKKFFDGNVSLLRKPAVMNKNCREGGTVATLCKC